MCIIYNPRQNLCNLQLGRLLIKHGNIWCTNQDPSANKREGSEQNFISLSFKLTQVFSSQELRLLSHLWLGSLGLDQGEKKKYYIVTFFQTNKKRNKHEAIVHWQIRNSGDWQQLIRHFRVPYVFNYFLQGHNDL